MKINYVVKFAALTMVCCMFFGCKPEEEIEKFGTIYGTIFNKVTHEPVNGAQVEYGYYTASNILYNGHPSSIEYHRISSAISGYDGQYEMQFEEVQFDLDFNDGYYISATYNGFQGYHSSAVNGNGGVYRLDINLEPDEPAVESFKVTINGVEIDTIYFEEGINTSTFLVTNDGTIDIIVRGNATTGLRLKDPPGNNVDDFSYKKLKPNEGYPIIVKIDNNYFPGVGCVYLNSAQVSKTLVVKRI